MIEQILQNIGLTQNETKVYMSLLDLGESKTGLILKKSGLNSGKIYEIMDSLIKKGLVSEVIKEGVKFFSPADPKRVLDYLDDKKEGIKKQEDEYKEVLPQLMEKINAIKPNTNIEIYMGVKGMKTAYAKEFNYTEGSTLYAAGISSPKNYRAELWKYFENIHRKKREGLFKVKKLLSEDSRDLIGTHEKGAEVKFLPFVSLVVTTVIGDLVNIAIDSSELIVISIESQEVADSFRNQFELMWKIAKE